MINSNKGFKHRILTYMIIMRIHIAINDVDYDSEKGFITYMSDHWPHQPIFLDVSFCGGHELG